MTQWNKPRCGKPNGKDGTCCCSYCEGYQDALDEAHRLVELEADREKKLAKHMSKKDRHTAMLAEERELALIRALDEVKNA